MAGWKTYAKAARNTARKQAPGVSRSAREAADRGSRRAGDYVRAAGRAVERTRREETSAPHGERREDASQRPGERRREYDPLDRDRAPRDQDLRDQEDGGGHDAVHGAQERRPRCESADEPETLRDPRTGVDSAGDGRAGADADRLGRDAAAYYTVARRRARSAGKQVRAAQLGPRIMRAVRDALLIGLSLLAIWLVLAAAGLQIPFTAVLAAVGVIVAISFGTSLYASTKRSRQREDEDEDEGEGEEP